MKLAVLFLPGKGIDGIGKFPGLGINRKTAALSVAGKGRLLLKVVWYHFLLFDQVLSERENSVP